VGVVAAASVSAGKCSKQRFRLASNSWEKYQQQWLQLALNPWPFHYNQNKSSGLYYRNITIINDTSRVVSDRWDNLEHLLWSSIMLLE